MVQSKSLLFIPDISGFTEFVKQTEIAHSQHIISELLEILIDANELDMTVSEIEGDAILFYKHEQLPGIEEIIEQSRNMFLAFHNHLKLYETRRVCQCGACSTASELTLKVIAHAGEVGFIQVKERRKPHGSDVILVHNLLKNSVEENEYLLVTEQLYKTDSQTLPANEIKFISGNNEYAKLGRVCYNYAPFKPLRKLVKAPEPLRLPGKIHDPIVFEGVINRRAEDVFEIISNLDLRLTWSSGLDELLYKKERVNRVGTKHTCLVSGKKLEFETVTNDFGDSKIVYGERIVSLPIVKEFSVYYILEHLEGKTKVRVEVHYLPLPVIGKLLIPLFKRNIGKNIETGFKAIKKVCEDQRDKIESDL